MALWPTASAPARGVVGHRGVHAGLAGAPCRKASGNWCFSGRCRPVDRCGHRGVARSSATCSARPGAEGDEPGHHLLRRGPAIAPIIGGWLFVHAGWHGIFWFLTGVGVLLVANFRLLPETSMSTTASPSNAEPDAGLPAAVLQPCAFMPLALASGIPFNGMFLCAVGARVPGARTWVLRPRSSSGFVLTIAGIMRGGSWASGGWRAASPRSGRSATAFW